jgi:hypothetical protein
MRSPAGVGTAAILALAGKTFILMHWFSGTKRYFVVAVLATERADCGLRAAEKPPEGEPIVGTPNAAARARRSASRQRKVRGQVRGKDSFAAA